MRLHGTQSVEVNVTTTEAVHGLIGVICQKYKLYRDDAIEDGNIVNFESHHHGSDTKYIRRKATETDVKALATIEFLRNLTLAAHDD